MRVGGTCYVEPESDTAGNLTRGPKLTPPKLSSKEDGGDWLEVQGNLEETAVRPHGSEQDWALSGDRLGYRPPSVRSHDSLPIHHLVSGLMPGQPQRIRLLSS